VLRPAAYLLNTTPERRDGFRHESSNDRERRLYEIPFAKEWCRGLAIDLATLVVVEELAYFNRASLARFRRPSILSQGRLTVAASYAPYLPKLCAASLSARSPPVNRTPATDLSVDQ